MLYDLFRATFNMWLTLTYCTFFIQKQLKMLFLSLILGIQSKVNVCGSWATSQKSLKMKVNLLWDSLLEILLVKNEDLDQLLAASECICLCFTPRCRVPEGQVWAVERTLQPLHPGRAVYERREHPVRSGHGAAGEWVQTFSQQEEICHR